MWLLNWLLDRVTQVQNVIDSWYTNIKYWAVTLFWIAVWFFSSLLDKTAEWIATWWAKSRKIALDWYNYISYLVNTATVYLVDWIDNWLAKSKKLAGDWYDTIAYWVQTAKSKIKDFIDTWMAGAKILATLWYAGIDWLVNTALTALKDFKDNWLAGAKILSTLWYGGIDWLVNTALDALRDFKDNWLAGAKLISTAWRSVIDWYVNVINNLIRDFVENWLAGAKWLSTTGFATLLDLINNLYTTLSTLARTYSGPLVTFIDDPVNWLVGLLESVAWKWGEWFLAFLLGGVNFILPPRPTFGGGSLPGNPPEGPGPGGQGLIWPCDNHRVSGYSFGNPPGHNGLDIGAGDNSPIWSIRGGVVTAAGWSEHGYGIYVDVQHDGGWWSRYAHFKGVYVHQNQTVTQGQTLGLCDSTGNSSGPHLHLEIKYNGSYVDPLQVLG